MKVRVRIPKETKEYFDKYGSLSYCINRLFDEYGDTWIETPVYGHRKLDNLSSTIVTIDSPYYKVYRDVFPAHSPQISPSRLLIHAHETDYCTLANWEPKSKLTDILYQIQQLSKEQQKLLLNTLKEKYL